jgi:hypothetical protein
VTQDKKNVRSFQFRLRSLFFLTFVVGVGAFLARLIPHIYYWQLNEVKAVLSAHPEIENVEIIENEDLWYEVEVIRFSIVGRPNYAITIRIPHGALRWKIERLVHDALKDQSTGSQSL